MLEQLLAQRGWLLADGAIATNLFDLGLAIGEAPETWLTLHPERIKALHRRFLDAGADVILTNTFGGNRRRLAHHHLATEVRGINRIAATLACDAASGAGRPIVIAGSVGPIGERLAPFGSLTETDAIEIFTEQMEGLREGGADVVWIETMSAVGEMRAAVAAARRVGLRCVVTASFHGSGCTAEGYAPEVIAQVLAALPSPPLAIGTNCGKGLSDLVVSILALTAADPAAVVVAKGNCGLPRVVDGRLIYTVTPAQMHAYAQLARDAGARIIGGCCGTTPAHLAAMRDALDGYQPRPRPDVDEVIAALGPLSR